MHRRAVLKSVFSTFAGAGLLLSARAASAPPSEMQTPTSETKGQPTSFLTTSDGTSLFYRDWGAGSPLVFLAPWGLHSDWWEWLSYPRTGCVALPMTTADMAVPSNPRLATNSTPCPTISAL